MLAHEQPSLTADGFQFIKGEGGGSEKGEIGFARTLASAIYHSNY